MNKFSIFFSVIVLLFTVFSCNKEDKDVGENEISIVVLQPNDQQVLDKSQPVEVKVDFEATISLHDIEMTILSKDSAQVEVLRWDGHSHQKSISFSETLDLSGFASGTAFEWEIKACLNHECEEPNYLLEKISFTVE
jgi:hypothetical protein